MTGLSIGRRRACSFFFFNDTATTEIYTLSLHDALPISLKVGARVRHGRWGEGLVVGVERSGGDRKSTRLNSSHSQISYAVFCLKKKKIKTLRRPLLLLAYTSPSVTSRRLHSTLCSSLRS